MVPGVFHLEVLFGRVDFLFRFSVFLSSREAAAGPLETARWAVVVDFRAVSLEVGSVDVVDGVRGILVMREGQAGLVFVSVLSM